MNAGISTPQRIVPPSRRRDKPILSCNLCRRRKLKCDRKQPCKTCFDRGLSLSCTYSRNVPSSTLEPRATPNNVHDRIDQLERLVTSLIDSTATTNIPNPTTPNGFATTPRDTDPGSLQSDQSFAGEVAGTPDRVKLADDATTYTGSAHWTSILDGIAELKDHLDDIPTTPQPRDPTQSELSGPDLLFGHERHASQSDILASLPERSEVDKLITTYFASLDVSGAIIHKPSFMHEYNAFWKNPFGAPIMWLGLLFSILCVGTRFQHIHDYSGDEFCDPSATSLYLARMDFYRGKVVQCMILANYTKTPPHTIETFMHYFIAEYLRSQDAQFGTWVLIGMLIRMAFRTGYHRDPSRFPNISPFQGELRRRIWSLIVQLDLMSSIQVGLPRMIQRSMYDTEEPRNLIDEDLHEDLIELPPSRPDTDWTIMLYTLIRNRALDVLSRIIDVANASTQPAYRDIMSLDADLRAVYESMPEIMKGIRSKDFIYEDSVHAMRKTFLALTFLKAEVMLHRPYLLLGRTDSRYEYSRLASLDCALEILEYQKILETETRPGGRLWSLRWRVWSFTWRLSSLVNHDFLLATTVLSLDLDRDLTSPSSPNNSRIVFERFKSGQPTRAEIILALTSAYKIWVKSAQKSREAKKVAAAVKLVLRKANADPDIIYPESANAEQETEHEFANTYHADFQLPPQQPDILSIGINNIPFGIDRTTDFADELMDMAGFNWDFQIPHSRFEQNLNHSYLS
ncbi:hypothetical protein CC78DRAFT_502103 [Lojkania enalia]|uniref:Zn(2)-C6 fungal-type domain-containing protein n=1 Tax=Lojkania enalia TaxID=147567 RepID=A0A9P4K183_9PLEO|nr:hypothetical protein CC78DRAFT_502103 [Didymosphaeria enalia]